MVKVRVVVKVRVGLRLVPGQNTLCKHVLSKKSMQTFTEVFRMLLMLLGMLTQHDNVNQHVFYINFLLIFFIDFFYIFFVHSARLRISTRESSNLRNSWSSPAKRKPTLIQKRPR